MNHVFADLECAPDGDGLRNCILRRGTPARVHHIELFLDEEIKAAICARFRLCADLDPADPCFEMQREIRIQRALGYDYVRCGLDDLAMPLANAAVTTDTAPLSRTSGRRFQPADSGPIRSWQDFENYPWPNPDNAGTRRLEWYDRNLPDDMCVIGSGGFAHFAEYLTWLMGYTNLCYALSDQRDLVGAISERLLEIYEGALRIMLQFPRVTIVWGSDDMGFRSGPLISPDDLRTFVLPGHQRMAELCHAAGRPYLLHSCGNLSSIMPDLIDNVGIDAKHSFEDTIEQVSDAKRAYGDRIALLGGIDVDFLCRARPDQVRERVRATLDSCQSGGGYCLGSGNSVANYIPLDNYLAMLEEGRRYGT